MAKVITSRSTQKRVAASVVAAGNKAAEKAATIRKVFRDYAEKLTTANKSVAQLCYEAAMAARKEGANEAELALLRDAVTRQQWSDMMKIITYGGRLPSSAPKNLVKCAQFIRALEKGAPARLAKQHAEGKLSAKELDEKLGKAESKAKAKGAKTKAGADGSLHALHCAIEGVRKEYSDCPRVLEIVSELADMYQDLLAAAENA